MSILIAGPYRSGTNDDPKKMQANLEKLESVALPLFKLGHVPMIGERVALPLLKLAGTRRPATKCMKQYSTLLRTAYWINAMPYLEWRVNPWVRMKT